MHNFKKGIKLVICLLICVLVIKALDILLYPCTFVRNDIHTVTNEQKDVVILGTSNGMSDLDPDSMLEGTKMTGHNLCVGGEYPVDAYYLTKLVIEKQHPKIFISSSFIYMFFPSNDLLYHQFNDYQIEIV